jgi:chromosome segregation ATPase
MSYINKSKLPADGNREVRKEFITVTVENCSGKPELNGLEMQISYPVKTKVKKPTIRELVEKLVVKVDSIGADVADLKVRVTKIETRLEKVEIRLDGLETRLEDLETRVLKLEAR